MKSIAVAFGAVLTSMSVNAVQPDPAYGVVAHLTNHEFADYERTIDKIAESGIGMIRLDFCWADAERWKGHRDFTNWDKIVDRAASKGVKILGILDYAPPFYRPISQHLDEWADFVREVTRRYGKRLGVFEVWNEQNNPMFWPPNANPEEYADLLRVTYKAIKETEPSVTVVFGGLAGIPLDYIRRVYRRVGKDCFDVLAIHPYSPEGRLDLTLDKLRALMGEFGDAKKPIWATEIGWASAAVPLDGARLRQLLSAAHPEKKTWRMLLLGCHHSDDDPDTMTLAALRKALPPGSTVSGARPEDAARVLGRRETDAVFFPLSEEFPLAAMDAVSDFVKKGGTLVEFGGVPFYHAMRRVPGGSYTVDNSVDRGARMRLFKVSTDFPKERAHVAERYFTARDLEPGDELVPVEMVGSNVLAGVYRYAGGEKGCLCVDGRVLTMTPHGAGGLSPSDPDRQARRIATTVPMLAALGIEKVVVYEFRSMGKDANDPESHFGLMTPDFRPRPIYEAYRNVIRQRPGGSRQRPGAWRSDDFAFCFPQWTRPDGTKAGCFWSMLGTPRLVKVTFEGRPRFTDHFGKPRMIEVNDLGVAWLTLDGNPIYFSGAWLTDISQALEFSKAGYWDAPNSPRVVRSMNPGWEFSLNGFRTSKPVNLPHSIDEGELGLEASGCVNRQQPAWYRKTFDWHRTQTKAFLHFEAIMGKSRITVNGRQVAEHFGGFLPIHVDVSDVLTDGANTIEVWCDNSDDPAYPPGKRQDQLDWTYFGGIYRDCWLVETGEAYVSDSDRGGVYVTSKLERDGTWTVTADVTLGGAKGANAELFYDGEKVSSPFKPKNPTLWTPDTPELHRLDVRVRLNGRETDAVAVRFGIRDFMIDSNGLTLNGQPWRKLVGVNRHQDYAYVGMALSNSLHWRDAKKYRDAGFTVIRNAHYPQDPAFMDACDALGLFVIENPPGWQFWNKEDPLFERRVYDDILKMVRRDRSRASLFFWEPILNETSYPSDFARNTYKLVKRETRAPNFCACDLRAEGSEVYDLTYAQRKDRPEAPYFTREWGDFPDDWNAQNSPSRTPIEWGEGPMLVQADHYVSADYNRNVDKIIRGAANYLGGCLWHGADHARGYHPDNFFGGVLTYTRRKKYSYQAFKAKLTERPFVYLANQLEPYSPQTLTLYSNCTYRATWLGKDVRDGDRIDRDALRKFNRMASHAEGGWIDPRVLDFVVTLPDGTAVTNRHAARFARLTLELDEEGLPTVGDGSDLVSCAVMMCDAGGRPRRYQNEEVDFSVEGPAQLVGENPQRTRWGEAVVLVRPLACGEITVRAALTRSGAHLPPPAALTFKVSPSSVDSICGRVRPKPSSRGVVRRRQVGANRVVDLSEVEKQQKDFEVR